MTTEEKKRKIKFWLELTERYKESDVNMAVFAYQNNVNFETFRYWVFRILPANGYNFDLREHNEKLIRIRQEEARKWREKKEARPAAGADAVNAPIAWNVYEINKNCSECKTKLMLNEILEVLKKYDYFKS